MRAAVVVTRHSQHLEVSLFDASDLPIASFEAAPSIEPLLRTLEMDEDWTVERVVCARLDRLEARSAIGRSPGPCCPG